MFKVVRWDIIPLEIFFSMVRHVSICASVQIGMFFPLGEWTESGGEKTFVHTAPQFFQGIFVGLILAELFQ